MLSLVIALIAIFAYSGNAQTLLTAGQEYTNQVAGSWYYHVPEDAPLPGILRFNIYNNTAGTFSACISDCENDVAYCSQACSNPNFCTIEISPCAYLRGHDYYFFVRTFNSSSTFSVRLNDVAQNVTALTSTPISYNASLYTEIYSIFSFEVSDTDALNYIKVAFPDGKSAIEEGVQSGGYIYRSGDNSFGEYSFCGSGASASSVTYQSVLSFLSPYCPYESGTYYYIVPRNEWVGFNLQVSFQTYKTEPTAIPIGTSSYTISATQTDQFQFFYYDQTDSAITTTTFSTAQVTQASRIVTPFIAAYEDKKTIYPIVTGPTGCVASTRSLQEGQNSLFRSYPCSPQQGRYFFGLYTRAVPYTFSIDRDDNSMFFFFLRYFDSQNLRSDRGRNLLADPSTEFNTTSVGTLTQLDHTTGTQKLNHYWKIRDGLDLAHGQDYFQIFYNNTNNTEDVALTITRDAPSEPASCMTVQNQNFNCRAGQTCNFGVAACLILGEGQFYLTVTMDNTPPTNVGGSFLVTVNGTTRVERDSTATYDLAGTNIQAYSYSPSRQIVDLITIDRAPGNSLRLRYKLPAAVGEDQCGPFQIIEANGACPSYPCNIPVYCNQNNVGDLLFSGSSGSQSVERINYTLSAASYGDNSLYGRTMTANQSLTSKSFLTNSVTVLSGNSMYVYFKTQGNEGFKITVDKTTRTAAVYNLVRNDDCNIISNYAGTNSENDQYVFTNKPEMDSKGEFYFVVTPDSGANQNNTFTILLQTGDRDKSQFCNNITANVTFCAAYISNANGYAISNSNALAIDRHASIIYSHYAFHDASAQCMSDVKEFICHELFEPCSDNGATDNTCDKTCHDALSNCPSDEACLYQTCVSYLPCILVHPSSSTNVIYSLGLMLMIALLQFI